MRRARFGRAVAIVVAAGALAGCTGGGPIASTGAPDETPASPSPATPALDPTPSLPPPTPTPSPTPFPSPAPAALFGPEHCAGHVDYDFVGWSTMDQLNIDPSYEGHVFAMVTADVIATSDWADDPAGSGQTFRWWGQQVCFSQDLYIGAPYGNVPIGFDAVNGTGFKEWEDGRREPGDRP